MCKDLHLTVSVSRLLLRVSKWVIRPTIYPFGLSEVVILQGQPQCWTFWVCTQCTAKRNRSLFAIRNHGWMPHAFSCEEAESAAAEMQAAIKSVGHPNEAKQMGKIDRLLTWKQRVTRLLSHPLWAAITGFQLTWSDAAWASTNNFFRCIEGKGSSTKKKYI